MIKSYIKSVCSRWWDNYTWFSMVAMYGDAGDTAWKLEQRKKQQLKSEVDKEEVDTASMIKLDSIQIH